MEPFKILTAIAAPMPIINVDTDMIIPKQFLRTIKRTGLGIHAFDEMRYDEDGKENPDFILNQEPYKNAKILIAGKNFGCGSSREHAPWALLDFGLRCIIASSFADIFFNNCFKNGILPIVLDQNIVNVLMKEAEEKNEITIDLESQTIQSNIPFEIEPFRKHCLLEGLDDISLTLEKEKDITAYEIKNKEDQSFLWKGNTA